MSGEVTGTTEEADEHAGHDHTEQVGVTVDEHAGHNHTETVDEHAGHDHSELIDTTQNAESADEHDHDHDHAEGETQSSTSSGSSHAGHSHAQSCDNEPMLNYNLPFRIGSVFIIMGTSAIGIFAPIILYRISPPQEGSIREWTLTAGKFFGTGVIIATAFIHMLPESFIRFNSECLSEGWHSYHAFGGLFCMLAAFGLQIVELAALSNLDKLAKQNAPLDDNKLGEKEAYHHDEGHVHSAGLLEHEQSVRNIGTLILEFGIVMHSIIIGITLGTADNDSFSNLFVALIFHQFFEGIALGTRVNELGYKSWKKPILMGIIFISMTPIGIGIGIGVRSTLNPRASILAQAILDSLSAGILLYNAFVSLMGSEINQNTGFRRSALSRKIFCFFCMYVGAALMSVIGIWA